MKTKLLGVALLVSAAFVTSHETCPVKIGF